MGPAKDRELFEYFEGRRLWSLHPDRSTPELVELPRGTEGRIGGPVSP
jgi:hypothetical protein